MHIKMPQIVSDSLEIPNLATMLHLLHSEIYAARERDSLNG